MSHKGGSSAFLLARGSNECCKKILLDFLKTIFSLKMFNQASLAFIKKNPKTNCWPPVGVEDLELIKLWSIDAN